MGGGNGGAQNTVSEFKPPDYTVPGWQAYVNAGQTISQTPYKQSGLATVAPLNSMNQTAMQMAIDRAMNGAPDLNAGRSAAMNAANGAYANPWSNNVAGIASGNAYNPWSEGISGMAQGQQNPYTSSQYADQMIADTADNMANAYATGSAAQSATAANMAGAFGGGGQQAVDEAGRQGLEKQVGQMATQVRQQQQQYAGSQYQQDMGRMLQAYGMGSGNYNADVMNQLNANAQGGGFHDADIGNMLSGAGLAGQLSGDDYKSISMLQNTGNDYRQYQQQLLDALNGQWSTQNGYDAAMNEYLGNVLGRASGGQGSTTVTQGGGNNYSPLMGLAGLGLAGYGMFGK